MIKNKVMKRFERLRLAWRKPNNNILDQNENESKEDYKNRLTKITFTDCEQSHQAGVILFKLNSEGYKSNYTVPYKKKKDE